MQPSSKDRELKIKIVENQEELFKAFMVRAIVYIHEQNCPYEEEFDLNDFSSTQIIGQVGNEPVLTARIRYLGDAAKLERLAVRESFRGNGYGHQLLKYLMQICQQKGFTKLYLHAQNRLQSFYEGYGFRRMGKEFGFSDHEYIEMIADLPEAINALRIGQSPLLLNRPEGSLSAPGPIEKSLIRMAKPAPENLFYARIQG